MADELEKMQRALNQSYSDRDRIGSELDKYRDDLERSQVIYHSFDHLVNKAKMYCLKSYNLYGIFALKSYSFYGMQ